MKKWRLLNTGLILFYLFSGPTMVSQCARPHLREDWFACPLLAVGGLLFALGSVWYSRAETFIRPNWDRNPFDWRYDPLQALFIMTWGVTGWAVGGSFELLSVGDNGLLTVAMLFSTALGFFLGRLLVYRLFRERFTE
jgi:hypothetical protein